MQTLTVAQLQTNFGAAADIAQSGEVVTISEHGRPVLMLFSYKEGEALLRLRAVSELNRFREGRAQTMPRGEANMSLDDINAYVHETRA